MKKKTSKSKPTIDRGLIQVRVGADGKLRSELDSRVSSRTTDEVSPHLIARRDLERYYELLSDALRRVTLSEVEASLIVDVLNGTILDERSAQMIWAEIDDGIRHNSLDKKWKVDGSALVAKARAWGMAECMAVADAVERYWLRADDEPIADGLRRVGLIR